MGRLSQQRSIIERAERGERPVGVHTAEIRLDRDQCRADTGELILTGHAAVFDQPSEPIWGMFIEYLERGCFRKILATKPDTRLQENHDGPALARTTNGTLELREDPIGLWFRAKLNEKVQADRDLFERVLRGDMTQMSFRFNVAPGGVKWEWSAIDGDLDIARVREVSELPEISVVTFPAYTQTDVGTGDGSAGETQQGDAGGDEQRGARGSAPSMPDEAEALALAQARERDIQTARLRHRRI